MGSSVNPDCDIRFSTRDRTEEELKITKGFAGTNEIRRLVNMFDKRLLNMKIESRERLWNLQTHMSLRRYRTVYDQDNRYM